MKPAVGQVIRRGQVEQFDLDGFRLNWRPDNTAKVTRVDPDLTGMVQCCKAGTCGSAKFCAAGKPHAPDDRLDGLGRCYDHKPYVIGGVDVWCSLCVAFTPPV